GQVNYAPGAADAASFDLSKLGAAGKLFSEALKSVVSDFYLTNPIAPASETMAEISRLPAAAAPQAAAAAALWLPISGRLGGFWAGVGQILLIMVGLLISLAFLLLFDRKVWAAVQLRKGPNVVGPFGLLQSFADFFKFVLKEIVIPAGANKTVFILAPLL